MLITKNEFGTWKGDAVTREVFKVLKERKNVIAHRLADGGALIDTEREVMVGRYKEIDDLLNMTFEDMKEE